MSYSYILWLTGVDSLLRRATDSDGTHDCYDELLRLMMTRHVGNDDRSTVTSIAGGLILNQRGKKVALISADSYTPEQMRDDILAHSLTHVIFLRTTGQAPRQRYVEAAADLGMSFIKQQLPDPVLIQSEPETGIAPSPAGATSFLINIDRSKHYHAGRDINLNETSGDNRPRKGKRISIAGIVALIGEIVGAVTGGCSIISAILGL